MRIMIDVIIPGSDGKEGCRYVVDPEEFFRSENISGVREGIR